jgi:hypothetical protein
MAQNGHLGAEVDDMTMHLYRHFDADGKLLYVGISLSALSRLAQHKDHSAWYKSIVNVTIQEFPSREEALAAERRAILEEQPAHNIRRPKPETPINKISKLRGTAQEASREMLVWRIAEFNPVYTIDEVARALGIGPVIAKRLIEKGEIGHVILRYETCTGKPSKLYRVTGWQLIEYIEHLEQRTSKVA